MKSVKGNTLWIINHHAGGQGRHEYFARGLTERGWRVVLFAASYVHNVFVEQKDYAPGCCQVAEELRGVNRVWVKTPSYHGNGLSRILNHLAFALRVTVLGRKLCPPDIVIGSSAHLLAALAACCLAKIHRAIFIFEMRDIWPQSLVDIGALGRFSPLTAVMGALEKFLCRRARLIISALPRGEEHVAGLGVDRSKVIYIPNGVDLACFDRCARQNSLAPGIKALFDRIKGSMVFTYAGAHGYANGLETILGAAEILDRAGVSNIHLLLVGDGPGKAGLLKTAREKELINITFLGAVERIQVPVILRNSDVCLFHLRNSGAYRYGLSSNKFFDYMAAARPVIAAVNMPPFPGFQSFGLQVPSDDPRILALAILRMADKPFGERERMGLLAREFVEKFHDVTVLVEQLEHALNSVNDSTGNDSLQ